jgi:hypothetical protein
MDLRLPDGLADYLAARDRERSEQVTEALESLTPDQRAVIKAAAVMGYVQGKQAPPGAAIPPDSVILHGVIAACLAMHDLYPAIAALGQSDDQQGAEQ